MKDIGSIFPLYDDDLAQCEDNRVADHECRINFSLCREAMGAVADVLDGTNKTVLMPAYTCASVYLPFTQRGWNCVYYSVHRSLESDAECLMEVYEKNRPALTIFHPYYGKGLSVREKECIRAIHQCGGKVLVDNTQCIFSEERLPEVDYYTGSYRKWFPIPDGAFLESKERVASPEVEYETFCTAMKGSMYLRGQYFLSGNEDVKQLSIQLNKVANGLSYNQSQAHKMSEFSEKIMARQDYASNKAARMANFEKLLDNLDRSYLSFPISSKAELASAPLYFPIYLTDRHLLQKHMAEHHVYLPVIWPIGDVNTLISEKVKYIYEYILCIPIDQRYDIADMDKIITLINGFCGRD